MLLHRAVVKPELDRRKCGALVRYRTLRARRRTRCKNIILYAGAIGVRIPTERERNGRVGVQQRGIEHGKSAVLRADQKADLSATKNDAVGAR